jgi:hypothetical protein
MKENSEMNFDNSEVIVELNKGREPKAKKSMFKASAKKKMQLTFENITIQSIVKRRCGRGPISEPRTIIDGVSGSLVPG